MFRQDRPWRDDAEGWSIDNYVVAQLEEEEGNEQHREIGLGLGESQISNLVLEKGRNKARAEEEIHFSSFRPLV